MTDNSQLHYPVKIYILEKAWCDSMENEVSAAFGFTAFAATLSLELANSICENSEIISKEKYGWAAQYGGLGKRSIRYIELPLLAEGEEV